MPCRDGPAASSRERERRSRISGSPPNCSRVRSSSRPSGQAVPVVRAVGHPAAQDLSAQAVLDHEGGHGALPPGWDSWATMFSGSDVGLRPTRPRGGDRGGDATSPRRRRAVIEDADGGDGGPGHDTESSRSVVDGATHGPKGVGREAPCGAGSGRRDAGSAPSSGAAPGEPVLEDPVLACGQSPATRGARSRRPRGRRAGGRGRAPRGFCSISILASRSAGPQSERASARRQSARMRLRWRQCQEGREPVVRAPRTRVDHSRSLSSWRRTSRCRRSCEAMLELVMTVSCRDVGES